MSTMSATANSDWPTPEDKKKGFNLVKCSRTANSPRLTDGLHQHDVVPAALAENNGLVSCSGDSAKRSRGWRWSDKSVHVPGELSHTGLITQQRACSDTEEMREPQIYIASAQLSQEQTRAHFICFCGLLLFISYQ